MTVAVPGRRQAIAKRTNRKVPTQIFHASSCLDGCSRSGRLSSTAPAPTSILKRKWPPAMLGTPPPIWKRTETINFELRALCSPKCNESFSSSFTTNCEKRTAAALLTRQSGQGII